MNPTDENKPDNALVEQDIKKALRRLWCESQLCTLSYGCAIGLWLLGVIFLLLWIAFAAGYGNMVMYTTLLFPLFCIVSGALVLPRHRSKSLKILAARQDVRAVGPLLNAYDVSLGARTREIQSLLTQLLSRLKVSDSHLLTARQRLTLHNALTLGNADKETDFLVAILKALEQVGDTRTLTCVEELIRRGAVTAGQGRVLEAALECLPLLQSRIAQQSSRETLLRPSAPHASTAELLRPSQSAAPDVQPETLLRPVERT